MTNGSEIAVIGMSCRFPGAADLTAYWKNIKEGVESVSFFTDEELLAAGVEAAVLKNGNYVKANGVLDGEDKFDHNFFGISKSEACLMDPQHRVFLEETYKALEVAGYTGQRYKGNIGVFGSCDMNTYLLNNLVEDPETLRSIGDFQLMLLNDKDYLPSRVSYLLNLRGPGMTVQTACSSSLTAIHVASQHLLSGDCDIAVAGGAAVRNPQRTGYLYVQDMINSPDGHCRPFDEQAAGTVGGNGVGIVILKMLSDAIADGDNILAVIKGSAINNDGRNKAGFTAPAVRGQAEVIAEAIRVADIPADSIRYVETHGTATSLGDPIEIAALTQAYRKFTDKTSFCAIGSVKANIGHLSAAAGVAGFIKAVMAVNEGVLPPAINFSAPNPKIDFPSSPFFVNTRLTDWPQEIPRRAGVSSFGLGGTNVHVILEAPPVAAQKVVSPQPFVLTISAPEADILTQMSDRLSDFLGQDTPPALSNIAYTLHTGRSWFDCRRAVIADSAAEAASLLRKNSADVQTSLRQHPGLTVGFMFPGLGSQYGGMAKALYERESKFRESIDNCTALFNKYISRDLRALLLDMGADSILEDTAYAQQALFSVEYAVGSLLMHYGIVPRVLIGHSLGEFAAACLAGIFSLEDAVKVVAERSRLMNEMPDGAMMSVALDKDTLFALLPEGVSIAAYNAPAISVVSGDSDKIALFEKQLQERNITCNRLRARSAFHSAMTAQVREPFRKVLATVKLNAPVIPVISNVTGAVLTAEQACSPDYWVQHMTDAVQFEKGINLLLDAEAAVIIEAGPGNVLSSFLSHYPLNSAVHQVVPAMPHPKAERNDTRPFYRALALCWTRSLPVKWERFYEGMPVGKVALPTYPFKRERCWIDELAVKKRRIITREKTTGQLTPAEHLYTPIWKQSVVQAVKPHTDTCYIVAGEPGTLTNTLASALPDAVRISTCADEKMYEQLLTDAGVFSKRSATIFYFPGQDDEEGFHQLISLARMAGNYPSVSWQVFVVTNSIFSITGLETLYPYQSLAAGAARIIPLEYTYIKTRLVDVAGDITTVTHMLLKEKDLEDDQPFIAIRGNRRFEQELVKSPVTGSALRPVKEKGVYLITGGTRGVGLQIAAAIAGMAAGVRLALVSRNGANTTLSDDPDTHEYEQKARDIFARNNAEVLFLSADVSDHAAMEQVFALLHEKWGHISGIVHAAGVGDFYGIIQQRNRASMEEVLAPKVRGTVVLDQLVNYDTLDFMVLLSSLGTVLHQSKMGQVAYVAACDFVDTYAVYHHQQGKARTLTINWNDWKKVGMSVIANKHLARLFSIEEDDPIFSDAVQPDTGKAVFQAALGCGAARVIVSVRDLPALMKEDIFSHYRDRLLKATTPVASGEEITQEYNTTEEMLSATWCRYLGLNTVDPDKNFFTLGGHSLMGIQIMADIRERYGLALSVSVLYENPTITALAEVIDTQRWLQEGRNAVMDNESVEFEEGTI